MKIRDINFGSIDARSEIFSRDKKNTELFLNSFTPPPSFSLKKVLNGDKCIICGPKGSGKTAVLRYIQHELSKDNDSISRFVVFRDDITEQDREKLVNISLLRAYDDGSNEETDLKANDCLSAWQLFIHREIANAIEQSSDLVAKTNDVKLYLKLISELFAKYKTSGFKKLVSTISSGSLKLNLLGQGVEASAIFIDGHGNLDVSEFVRFCDDTVKSLCFNDEVKTPRINIFFDEINITFVSGKTFKTDAILIRDLIAACCKMNLFFSEHNLPIYIYSAIRTEVVKSVESSVRELQKWIDDVGVTIDWIAPKKSDKHPIVDVLHRRLNANEIEFYNKKIPLSQTDYKKYFDRTINGFKFENYLVNETWGRPRDLVRLLSLASKMAGNDTKLRETSFLENRINYSRSSWDEKRDELNTKYSQTQIETIKRSLTDFQTSFSYEQFESHISYLSRKDPRNNQFYDGRNIDAFLEDLFNVGIIGNLAQNRAGKYFPYFGYTGNTNFTVTQMFCTHRSLWDELRLTAPNENKHVKRRRAENSPSKKRR